MRWPSPTDARNSGLAVIRDEISIEEVAERELRQRAAELERANADLRQFAYAASHDLQEPLRALLLCAQTLKRGWSQKLDAEADELIGYMVDAAQRMSDQVEDLLRLARSSSSAVIPQPVSADQALDRALDNLVLARKEAGLRIVRAPLAVVLADGGQLSLVFQNLIANAIKFRRPGQEPRVRVSAALSDDVCRFTVADDGLGVAAEHAERIFSLFARLHGDDYPGTGVGLALCQKIVERHGGRIWLDPDAGPGATFHFTLPAA